MRLFKLPSHGDGYFVKLALKDYDYVYIYEALLKHNDVSYKWLCKSLNISKEKGESILTTLLLANLIGEDELVHLKEYKEKAKNLVWKAAQVNIYAERKDRRICMKTLPDEFWEAQEILKYIKYKKRRLI